MSRLSPEEWNDIWEKINNGLNSYQQNIYFLISNYSKIKQVLEAHGAIIDEDHNNMELAKYPDNINYLLNNLELIKRTYEGYFSDIANAINTKGVTVTSDDNYDTYDDKIYAIKVSSEDSGLNAGIGPVRENGLLDYSKTIYIPFGVTNLSEYAIRNPEQLTSIHFPDTLRQINNNALQECTLKSVIFPANCTVIGTKAFYDSSLQNISFLTKKQLSLGENSFASDSSSNYFQMQQISYQGPDQETADPSLILYSYCFNHSLGNTSFILGDNVKIKAYSYSFKNNNMNNTIIQMLYDKIAEENLSYNCFQYSNNLTEIHLNNKRYGGRFTFNLCNKLSDIYLSDNTKIIYSNTYPIYTSTKLNFHFVSDDQKINFIQDVHWTSRSCHEGKVYVGTTTSSHPYFYQAILGSYYMYNYNDWADGSFGTYDSDAFRGELNSSCVQSDLQLPGFFLNKINLTNDDIYNFMKHIEMAPLENGKASCLTGFLNGVNISKLRLPFSCDRLWWGLDKTSNMTNNIEQIIFENTSWDANLKLYSTGRLIFANGFNNVKTIVWEQAHENSSIRTQCLGTTQKTISNYGRQCYIEDSTLQNLEEVYFGEGFSTIEPSLFFSWCSTDVQETTYRGKVSTKESLMISDYPKLQIIYLPGSLTKEAVYGILTPNAISSMADRYYQYPFFCGRGYVNRLNNLNKILLGPEWKLSIELISYCYKDANNQDYFNAIIDPEAMIFNIKNLKDLTGTSSQFIRVTQKTIEDLKLYCTTFSGTTKTILKGTRYELEMTIPSFDDLVSILKEKKWQLIGVLGHGKAETPDISVAEIYPNDEISLIDILNQAEV